MNFINKGQLVAKINDIKIAENTKNKVDFVMIILIILPIVIFSISIITGRYSISLEQFIQIIICKITGNPIPIGVDSNIDTVMFQVRLPRIFAAMLIGAGLSMSGATYQGMFKNPMISPDILGASAGAGFGAAFGILMSFSSIGIQITSFIFGLFAVALSYFISKLISRGNNAILVLVLTGMVVSTLFQSLISLAKYVADPYSKMPAITFWLMGGLSSINGQDVKILLVLILSGGVPLMLIRWKINALSFGEEEAMALGINVSKIKFILVVCSTLMTAACVSVSGMIGWVGLIVPHLARMLVGPNYKVLLPTSCLIGCVYLLLVDDIARSVFSIEIPLGILTSLIGAPFFIHLLLKGKKGWA